MVRPSVRLPALDRITIPRQAGDQTLHNQCGGGDSRTATATTISGTARRRWPSEHLSRLPPRSALLRCPSRFQSAPPSLPLSLVSFFVSALFKVEPIPVISERRPKRERGKEGGEGQQHRRRQERAGGRSGRPLPPRPLPARAARRTPPPPGLQNRSGRAVRAGRRGTPAARAPRQRRRCGRRRRRQA